MGVEVRPLAIDLCCGVSGWGAGLIAAGFHVLGFDIENMFPVVGEEKPEHFSLCLQDIRSLDGRQFKDAALIVASPPCQAYSWMAMPWSLAKAKARSIRADETGEAMRQLNELFNTCFRIQREASEAAGRWIPMVVENVRGAIPWVGRSRYNFGSYHLWGDVPALMPTPSKSDVKVPGMGWYPPDDPRWRPGQGFNTIADRNLREEDGRKVPGFRFDGSGKSFQTASVEDTFGWSKQSDLRKNSSKSPARKAASARIAKIPLALATAVGQAYMGAYLTGKRVDLVPVQPDLWEE